jgi:hypothetical protein
MFSMSKSSIDQNDRKILQPQRRRSGLSKILKVEIVKIMARSLSKHYTKSRSKRSIIKKVGLSDINFLFLYGTVSRESFEKSRVILDLTKDNKICPFLYNLRLVSQCPLLKGQNVCDPDLSRDTVVA